MNMDTLVRQSLEAASKITGKGYDDEETQAIAFRLSCVAMAKELSE